MSNPLATLAGALIIGAVVLFIGRWSVVAGSNIDPRETRACLQLRRMIAQAS
jgi:hypothetical protein